MPPFMEREFRTTNVVEDFEFDKPKEDLKWKPISFQNARIKYKFKMFSKRVGANAKYIISQKQLDYPWVEISQNSPPLNTTFEETRTKEFTAVRMCKFGIPEEGAMVKILKNVEKE